jgi:hypothetical protein
MNTNQFIPEGKWASHFYFYLTLVVMAGLCLALVPDGTVDAVTSFFFVGN